MRKLNVALIGGGGFMGKAHSIAWALAPVARPVGVGVERLVLVDVDADIAARSASDYGWAESAADWQEVVRRPDVDIVDIVTPPQFHDAIAEAAIAAGKHVFCEKPITNDVASAIRLRDLAAAAGVVTQVGFNYRHAPAIAFARQLIDDGSIGRPLQVRATYLQDAGFGADPTRWRAQKATGGSGATGDIGSHIVDIAQYLLGDIVRVTSRMRTMWDDVEKGWRPEDDRLSGDLIDNTGLWLAEFESGALGTFACSSFAPGRKNRIEFEVDGSAGAVQFDWNDRDELGVAFVDQPPTLRGFRGVQMTDKHPDGWWRAPGFGNGYADISAMQLQKFLEGIVNGRSDRPDFATGAQVQRVVDAIARSARTGTWIDVERDDVTEAGR